MDLVPVLCRDGLLCLVSQPIINPLTNMREPANHHRRRRRCASAGSDLPPSRPASPSTFSLALGCLGISIHLATASDGWNRAVYDAASWGQGWSVGVASYCHDPGFDSCGCNLCGTHAAVASELCVTASFRVGSNSQHQFLWEHGRARCRLGHGREFVCLRVYPQYERVGFLALCCFISCRDCIDAVGEGRKRT